MAKIHLEQLPKELIAHIASFCNASSALHLSTTCRTIRAACWDHLIFKDILTASQVEIWKGDSLDLDAIASRSDVDVSIWARYAIADEWAGRLLASVPDDPTWIQAQPNHPLKQPKSYISYLPELFVVKHPFMADQVWDTAVLFQRQGNPSQIFCLAMTILCSKQGMLNLIQRLYSARSDWFVHSRDPGAYLWALCTIALWGRTKIQQRLAAWPYNAAARVPFIPLPTAHQIPLQPLSDRYALPVPFSRRPTELLGNPKSSFSSWDGWYRAHNLATLDSLTDGQWCGYYIHFGVQSEINAPLDAPMMDIQFEIDSTSVGTTEAWAETEVLQFYANNCIDGIDNFNLRGSVSVDNGEVKMTAKKKYQNVDISWDWDCRLTPFGIVGFWGRRVRRNSRVLAAGARFWDHRNSYSPDQDSLERAGLVWLWRKAWTEVSEG